MISRSIFKKNKPKYKKKILFIFIVLLLITLIYFFHTNKYNNFIIIKENKENFYIIPKDKGGEKVQNLDKKILNLKSKQTYNIKINKPKLINSSKIGNSFDTSLVEAKLSNNALISIFSTYNSAYSKNFIFLFENGIIQQKNDIISIHGPTLNLDKKGFFKAPKLKEKIRINQNKDLKNSLIDSIAFFLDHAKKNNIFEKKYWVNSIKSNSLVLND